MRAAGLLVAGMSNEQVAAELGIHPCTVAHWKSDERFEGYLSLLQHEANERLLQRVVESISKALDVMDRIIDDPKLPWTEKVKIGVRILELIR